MNHLQGQVTGEDTLPTQGAVEGSGFHPGDDKRASQETLKQFQKQQIEEKKVKTETYGSCQKNPNPQKAAFYSVCVSTCAPAEERAAEEARRGAT